MIESIGFAAICPYCSCKNMVTIDDPDVFGGEGIVTCELEDGGCDRDFVASYRIEVLVKIGSIHWDGETDEGKDNQSDSPTTP